MDLPKESLKKTTHEMIRNGTWSYRDGVFWMCLPEGIAGFDGENYYLDDLGEKEKKKAKKVIDFVLGLEIDLDSFYSEISDSKFSFLIDEFWGLRPPASPTPYQALVETIAQQQVSFEFAMRTIERLVKIAGRKGKLGLYRFPEVEEVLRAGERIRKAKLGYRADYILGLSKEVIEGKLRLEDVRGMSEEEGIRYLIGFRGIGRWSAELFLTYAFRKNTYPAGDLGIRRGIAAIFGLRAKEVKEKDVRDLIDPFGKWKNLLAFYVICYDRKLQKNKK